MAEKYFIASNSADGFCSYYDEAFDVRKFSKKYIIKGGSGTGKAFFMRDVAAAAEQRGFSVRYIYCSSDAQSLDGIIINEPGIAVLDGTSPHIAEPKLLGAAEHFVDLSQFLDEKKLVGERKVIEKLTAEKTTRFEAAYRYLFAYRELEDNICELIRPAVRFDKIEDFCKRFLRGTESENGETEHLLSRSIGMHGLSSYPTYRDTASIYYEINDYYSTAHFFTQALFNIFAEKKTDIRFSPNPIIPSNIDALCVKTNGLTFEIGNEGGEKARSINMKRFVDHYRIAELRESYREAARARDAVLELALAEFEKIKKVHFLLEKLYGSAMDFGAKERFTEIFLQNLF